MSTPVRAAAASLRVFIASLIDYAGLFPPASLDMLTCMSNYSRYLNGPQRWALGRFVLPVARLDEFLNAQENVAAGAWKLSGIVSAEVAAELAAVDGFNRKAPGAVMDSVEMRVRSGQEIEFALRHLPEGVTAVFEISLEQAGELLPILKRVDAAAKLRTGGVVEEAFPAVERIAGFITSCAEQGVAFKATAGLHHPLRCIRPLTYEANAREGMMHGFLNLFTSAAIAWGAARARNAVPRRILEACLTDDERANWHFDESSLTWSGEDEPVQIDLEGLRAVRSEFALSFGSCSFEEPLADLHELGLL